MLLIERRGGAGPAGDRHNVITDASVGGVVAALRKVRVELADRDVGHAIEWEERVIGPAIGLAEPARGAIGSVKHIRQRPIQILERIRQPLA